MAHREGPPTVPASALPWNAQGWRSLSPTTRRLILTRTVRSAGQGALVVDFALYLKSLHWTALAIGTLIGAGGFASAILVLTVGVLSDRFGPKRFLLVYELLAIAGGLVLAFTRSPWGIVPASVLLGLGRGASGAAGPFAAAEQAWLANSVSTPRRAAVFSLNAALTFAGMGVGALVAGLVPLFAHLSPGDPYAPLFWLAALTAAVNFLQLALTAPVPVASEPTKDAGAAAITRQENRALLLLMLVNAVNALAVGLVSPLLPYWFSVRFGMGPSAIGPLYAATFFATGLSSLLAGRLATRVGLVRSIVSVRLFGVFLMAGLPFLPTYPLAAGTYLVRSVLNRGTVGTRQAFGVSLVRGNRRGLASSLNALSMRLPSSIGPIFGGWLFGLGELTLPFLLAAALQLLYVLLFRTVLGRYEPHEA
jgi:MFS family permease